MTTTIQSERLDLIPMTPPVLRALLEGRNRMSRRLRGTAGSLLPL